MIFVFAILYKLFIFNIKFLQSCLILNQFKAINILLRKNIERNDENLGDELAFQCIILLLAIVFSCIGLIFNYRM